MLVYVGNYLNADNSLTPTPQTKVVKLW